MSEAPTTATPGPAAEPQLPRSFWLAPDGTLHRDITPAQIRNAIETHAGELWVDLDVANRHHVAFLEHACGFHPLAIEDALNPNSRVKIEEYPGFLFVIIRGVRFFEETHDPYDLETFNLAFFLGPNYLVTAHGGPATGVNGWAERLERSPALLERGAERLMHAIMDVAVDAYFPLLDQIDRFVDGLEERVFSRFDQEAMHDIFAVRRVLLTLRRHLAPQREVFNVLSNRPSALLASESQVYFRDVYDHMLRITETIDTYRELLGGTMESYLTQVSNRLGMVTKGLSVVATMSIPFVVVSGMWGMNVPVPFAHHANAFWIMLAVQLAMGATLLGILRWTRLI